MPRITKRELIDLQKKLGTDGAIAEKYRITRQAVHQMRQLYGIPSRFAKNPERNAKIVTQHDKGTATAAIAAKFGLSYISVYQIIKKAKAKPVKSVKAPKPALTRKPRRSA
jgi:Mor family transcriptional regulator